MKILLERIKILAKENKINLKDLSKNLGWGENTLYKWATQSPSVDKIDKVANYFNVSTDYLLGRTDLKRYVIPDERFQTFAAHIDDDATEEEIEEILAFIEFKKNLKKNK
ncbi:helix-turn-helix domain-containing protein [Kurthia populi]|uniref:Helix-turn-helix domain-containing protein n=1 Tax=Kurthia populi TaxID=1562132 RepID=A0ABW5Y3I6_9BACL